MNVILSLIRYTVTKLLNTNAIDLINYENSNLKLLIYTWQNSKFDIDHEVNKIY